MEILWKKIYFINRKKLWKNINIDINKNLKLDIYSHLKKWLTEWSIIWHKKAVVWWWKTKNIQKNPLLK
jgi:hypothetical protein